ncbi:hypothetical protein Pmar_PMAR026497 [Perkinsus marinus ATCC 50983]|uniref:EF-hand domain-containing protein n=2 Tax=Perkinsus marinus (strain ATCC 50983 / TXsc) TaxID=423536 RepID=C5LDP9_PERM5|nr:hypothetical protein Pmar_PMAR026497 [Perkinsus marinus ATCC 50983]EER05063.1 hypothetical protein Pmar_PMAR026497 [Perkinsus marinus ATCC 50983]|eukprot:XP_002773247.1 hypothetical protein Pmar_PMAR026497 [Perkinsus marinus ATCC 50983]
MKLAKVRGGALSLQCKYGMSILDVEKVKKELDSYDADNSGTIDREEFNTFIRNVFGAKDKYDIPARRLEEFWKMLDTDQKGEVTLEEFVGFFWKYFWTRGGDVPGAQLSLLDCIGRVPTWSEERINGIAFGHLLNRLNDALEGEESESDEDKGCVEPEPVSLKLVKAVLLRILEKRLRSYPSFRPPFLQYSLMSLLVMFLVASSIAVAAMAIRGNPSALRVDSVARSGRASDVLQAQTEETINGYMQTVKGVLSQ